MIERLEKMLAAGEDNAMLRFTLGNAYLKTDPEKACEHLQQAVGLDPDYSAAWKLLGRAQQARGDESAALAAFQQGLVVAQARGDMQAVKEMLVFVRRIEKNRDA